jgi:hypothetical protein
MAEKERITSPSMGSNELGKDTVEVEGSGIPAGTDTQVHIAALASEKLKKNKADKPKKNKNIIKDVNDDERVVKNADGSSEFLEAGETDE